MQTSVMQTSKLARRRWAIRGQVQGVGFRPFVYRIAQELGVSGFVRNESSAVIIEAQAEEVVLERFGRVLEREHPPICRIESVLSWPIPVVEEEGFQIAQSSADLRHRPVVTVDTAVCGDCVRELFDPADFRYRLSPDQLHQLRSAVHDHPGDAL